MNDSISALLSAGRTDKETGEKVVLIHRSQLVPKASNDRDDWDDPETKAHIKSIAESMQIRLTDGKFYGIRTPLVVKPANNEGLHEITSGECRWRASDLPVEELQYLPCIIREGDTKEERLDHVTENGNRRALNLFQVARSIKRDKEEFGLSTEEIIAIHGLTGKSQLSKYMAVFNLNEKAQAFAREGAFKDINLVYELKKLDEGQLDKLKKKIDKGESFQQALKSLLPKPAKQAKETSANAQEAGNSSPQISESETERTQGNNITLDLPLEHARALAALLDVENVESLDVQNLREAIKSAAAHLASTEPA